MFFTIQKKLIARLVLILALAGGLFGAAPVQIVHAAILVVTNTGDSGPGSLRQAIASAGSGDTVSFDSSLGAYSILNLDSPLVIDKDLTIDASNLANPLPMDLWNGSNIQILNSAVTILDLTIQRGYSNGDGGAIWSNGNLTLKNSTIKDSYATGNGGAIFSSGTLTIQNSAIYDNTASLDGGGIYTATSGDQVQIANSTLYGNYAHQHAGGIYTTGDTNISLVNSTIAQNYAGTISQMISQGQSQVTLANTIIACSSWSPMDCYDLVQPPTMTNSILGDQGNTYGLLDLADNGGPTKTMSMAATSPLIDAGDDAVCASNLINNVDQRRVARPFGSHCDIGAYELAYDTISGNAGIGGTALKYGYGLFTTADNNGNYSFKVLPGWSGTLIPSKQGYSFQPAKRDYSNIQRNQTNQNYSATVNTFTYPGYPGATWRISVPPGGGEADGWSDSPSISADGRYIAYASQASNIVGGDWTDDIFVYDIQTGQTTSASVATDGTPLDCNSFAPSISADGRYVAFTSCAGGGAVYWMVYIYDRQAGILTGIARGFNPSLSADGRYIAYTSTDNDSHQARIVVEDVFTVFTKEGIHVSTSFSGGEPDGDSYLPSISADGRYVAFYSEATNLIDNDTDGVEDVFVYDLQAKEMRRVSVNSSGAQANGASFLPSISPDGRYVAFNSSASNLVSNDTNGLADVFVSDLQTGEIIRVSVDSNGLEGNQASDQAHLFGNGRYVAFRSLATNLISGDTNEAADIFIHDRQSGQTRRVSVDSSGAQANGDSPSMDALQFSVSEDGKFLAFSSDATNLVSGDKSSYTDVFVHETTCASCINISIGGEFKGNYNVSVHQSTRQSFPRANNGPVRITSINNSPIIGAERVIYKVNNIPTSFTEMMGLPDSQLDNTYWLPWYNNVDLDTQLRIGNVSGSTATVHVFIGGTEVTPVSGLSLGAGASARLSYPGVNNGPVKIQSNQNIVAAERLIYKVSGVNTSFSEMMALPNSQLNSVYWLPWYNNVDLDSQLRIGNVSGNPATVHIFIGGTEVTPIAGISLGAGASTRLSYPGVNNGPVKIQSNQNIVAAERVIYKARGGLNTSFTEMMGLPDSQLNTTYWLPWYNNADLDTQLRFGNVSSNTAHVHVYIGGTEMTGSPFTLGVGLSTRLSFAGVNNGPVKIQSDQNIVAAERLIYKVNGTPTSFSEMMALPDTQLNATYWLPWYNNVDLDTQLRFGVP